MILILCEKHRMVKSYWLLKTEPETYQFSQLIEDGKTNWNGVRNFQARNYLKQAQVGDRTLIYHSGGDKAVIGVAEVIRAAYPDLDPEKAGEWVQIDLAPAQSFTRAVKLAELKAHPALQDLILIKQSRLSVMPVTHPHFDLICQLGGLQK